MRHWRTTENSNMATQIGSTYISESMIDIIKIPMAKLRFSTTVSSNKMPRQPEMTANTGNTYISETIKYIIKIPEKNLGFTTTDSWKKASTTDCNSYRQPEIAKYLYLRTWQITAIQRQISVFDHAELEKTVIGRLRQRLTTGNSTVDILGAKLANSAVSRCRNHLDTLLSSSSWSKIPSLPSEFRRYLS